MLRHLGLPVDAPLPPDWPVNQNRAAKGERRGLQLAPSAQLPGFLDGSTWLGTQELRKTPLAFTGTAHVRTATDGGHRIVCSRCSRVGYTAGPTSTHPIKLAE